MSKLREALEAGAFPLVAAIEPPKGVAREGWLDPVRALAGKVTAFGVPDNAEARMGLSALAAAVLVKEAGGEPLLHLSCRDRNRLALESDLLGAGVLGLENILAVSGDYVTLGDHPQAKAVYDADSVQLLQIAQGLMAGYDSAGLPLEGTPNFYLGAVFIPEADPLGPQLLKIRKKVAAGAQFFITAPIFEVEKFRSFRESLGNQPVKILACVKVAGPEEVAQADKGQHRRVYSLPGAVLQALTGKDPEEMLQQGAARAGKLLKQIRAEGLADGAYVQARGRSDLLARVLESAAG
ncbi:MAG: methylenetetrahydrofolate reductase [Thermodesulfobacteriota bacterium]